MAHFGGQPQHIIGQGIELIFARRRVFPVLVRQAVYVRGAFFQRHPLPANHLIQQVLETLPPIAPGHPLAVFFDEFRRFP